MSTAGTLSRNIKATCHASKMSPWTSTLSASTHYWRGISGSTPGSGEPAIDSVIPSGTCQMATSSGHGSDELTYEYLPRRVWGRNGTATCGPCTPSQSTSDASWATTPTTPPTSSTSPASATAWRRGRRRNRRRCDDGWVMYFTTSWHLGPLVLQRQLV